MARRTIDKCFDHLLHLVDLTRRCEAHGQSIHGLELLEAHVHVLARLATESHLQLAKSRPEGRLVCTDKLVILLSIEDEVELRNGLHLESLRRLSV